MQTIADQGALFTSSEREALTRGNATAEPVPAEKPKRCPRCQDLIDGQRFWGPCARCRDELRTGATITAPRPPQEPTEPDAVAVAITPPAAPVKVAHVAGGLTTRRWSTTAARVCAMVDLRAGYGVTEDGRRWPVTDTGAGDLLDQLPLDVRHVYLIGARPGGANLAHFGYWRTATGQWAEAPAGHWLHNLTSPVLRYADPAGRLVDVSMADAWYGDTSTAGADTIAHAHAELRRLIAARFDGAELQVGPAGTGRALWLRTIPEHGWPTVTAATAELIRSTSGQHRYEVIDHGAGHLARLVELDGRWMYAALCASLPAGVPVRGGGEPDPVALGYTAGQQEHVRARYRASWTVPAGWAHLGLLGAHDPDEPGAWHYPRRPGQTASAWIDGAELQLARRWGWTVKVHEHIAWPKPAGPGPLDQWARRLIAARAAADKITGAHGPMVRAGVRSILMHGLAVLHGRAQLVTRTAHLDDTAAIPTTARDLHIADGQWTWAEPAPVARHTDSEHPELTAAVWARERVRILDGRGPGGIRTGALHLPFESIVAISGDAIYSTVDPGWADDGANGRLRTKAHHAGPIPAPTTRADLLGLLTELHK